MTMQEMKDFAESQITYYTRDIEHQSREIQFLTKEIAKSRESDREVQKYALESNWPETVKATFAGKYESGETRKLLNDRRRCCRNRQYAKARIEHFTKEAAKYEAMIEKYGNR